MEPIVLIDVERCVGCYMCVRSCALAQCIEVNEITRIAEVKRPEDCTGCRACERACPYNCITVISDETLVPIRAKVTLSRVRRYINRDLKIVNSVVSVREAAQTMARESVGSLLILEDKARIVTESDLLTAWSQGKEDEKIIKVSKEAIVAEGKITIQEALELFMRIGINHLPIAENGEIVGMFSIRDALKALSVTVLLNGERIVPVSPKEKVKDFAIICPVLERPTNEDVLTSLRESGLRAVLATDGERVGLVSVRDLIRAMANGEVLEDSAKPRWITPISEEDPLERAVSIMAEHGLRNLPVKGEELKLLSVREIVRHAVWVTIRNQ
jgi:CBS domain-containing protein